VTMTAEDKRLEFFTMLFGKENSKNAARQFAKAGNRIFLGAFIAFLLSWVSLFQSVQVLLFPFASYIRKIPRFDADIIQLKIHFGDVHERFFVSIYCFLAAYFLLFGSYTIFKATNEFIFKKIYLDFSCFEENRIKLYITRFFLFTLLIIYFYFYQSKDHIEVENLSFIGPLYATGLIIPFQFMMISLVLLMLYMYIAYISTFTVGTISHLFKIGGKNAK
jgi:hypothetical protein